MKLKVLSVVVILGSFAMPSLGLPFEGFGLAPVAEVGEPLDELKRDKRTLTTICVEIKPSTPYDEPYFMCKGTDSPKYSKDTYSESYSSKPSYKPSKPSKYGSGGSDSYHSEVKKISDYHSPSKSEYHGHSSYDKPPSSYEAPKEYSTPSKSSYGKGSSYNEHGNQQSDGYSNYEAPPKVYASAKPTYDDHHDREDEYVKPHQSHKLTYEKPSTSSYSSKPQTYNQEYPKTPTSYDHRHQPMEYSKPSSYENQHESASGGYSKPTNSYEPKEYTKPISYSHSSSYDSNPSYKGESHLKPSYGPSDGHSYSAPPETKVLYSKPASYPSKHVTYEHTDNTQYNQHHEQSSSKPYKQPDHHEYEKPQYHESDHQSHNYRMMPQELIQPTPTWEYQPQPLQYDDLSYRSYGGMEFENQNTDTPRTMNHDMPIYSGMEGGPLRFDLSDSTPTLQSPHQIQSFSSPGYQTHQAPSYAPNMHYAPEVPSYSAYRPAAPVHNPSYVAPSMPTDSTYGPTPSSYRPALPACQPSYMYSFQPVIVPVPCYSVPTTYSSSTYGQSLGVASNPQNSQSSYLGSLQNYSSARSEDNTESKPSDDHSGSNETQESDKLTEPAIEHSQLTSMKSESLKKSSDNNEEKNQQAVEKNSQDQTSPPVAKAQDDGKQTQTVTPTPQNSPEGPTTKEAYTAMMKMARIAAQLNKDDTKNGSTDSAGPETVQGNGKPSESLPQFTRSN